MGNEKVIAESKGRHGFQNTAKKKKRFMKFVEEDTVNS